jgi:hypothetical protein
MSRAFWAAIVSRRRMRSARPRGAASHTAIAAASIAALLSGCVAVERLGNAHGHP